MRKLMILFLLSVYALLVSCSTAYKAKPLPFRAPSSYVNATKVAGAVVGARAFADEETAQEAFGFNVRGAGMLPVQLVIDNRGENPLEIVAGQTFLEDEEGNLWPILARDIAYERATRYARTKEIAREGAYHGLLSGAAGAVIGAAIGIVAGENVAEAAGKGAAVGAAAGGTLGGVKGFSSGDARRKVIEDLRRKSLDNKSIVPNDLAFGFLFFPGEAESAFQLRLQLREGRTGRTHLIYLPLYGASGEGQALR